MDFCVGFMREALSDRILMVRKAKPTWQTGLLNGVGGKVDHQVPVVPEAVAQVAAKITNRPVADFQTQTRLETPLEAMVREFREETGIQTTPDEWRLVLFMNDKRDFYTGGEGGTVYWFAATRRFLPKLPPRVLDSGEELTTVRLQDVWSRPDMLASPRWVIPMAFLDSTLEPLGFDEGVKAVANLATATPKFDQRGYLDKIVQENRQAISDNLRAKLGVTLAPIPAPPVSDTPTVAAPATVKVDRAPTSKMGEAGVWPPLDAVGQDAAPEDAPQPIVGCKARWAYPQGTDLCGCEDGRCQGIGVSPRDMVRERVKARRAGEAVFSRGGMADLKAAANVQVTRWFTTENPHGFRIGDHVINHAKTEHGTIVAIQHDQAWVEAPSGPNAAGTKRVTLYLRDLDFQRGKPWTINGDKIVDVARISKLERDGTVSDRSGVVILDGVARHHNGRALTDMASGPATSKPGLSALPTGKPVPYEALPAPLRDLATALRDKHFPPARAPIKRFAEPTERPDAEWVDGGGAQEHFGDKPLPGSRAAIQAAIDRAKTRGLPKMQEQGQRP
jgi:8-oxo-dGTP pyrophosphatase MutT (NUDIX family)